MDFDPNKALAYARALARPRLVGSGEDERVAGELVAQLESFGYKVKLEPFLFTRAFENALTIEIGLALVLILAALLWPDFRPVALAIIAALLLGVFILNVNAWIQSLAVAPSLDSVKQVSQRKHWGRQYRSANVVAESPPSTQDSAHAHLYLIAHLDSKSQRLPIVVRVLLISGFILCLLIFVFAIFLPDPSLLIVTLLAWALGVPLLFLDVGNESPGAIDNAAGMGLVLHLAEVLQSRPDYFGNLLLTILITSAEEMATMGALYHIKRHNAEFEGEASKSARELYFLNFDGIGTDGRLFIASENNELAKRIEAAAAELKVLLSHFRLPGLLFDHIPFCQYGYEAVTLLSVGKSSWAVHTPDDTPEKLSVAGFDRAGKVALKVIEKIAVEQRHG